MEQEKIAIDKSAIKLSKEEIIDRLQYNNKLLDIAIDTIDHLNNIYRQSCCLTESLNKILVEERKEKDNINSTKDINKTAPGELIITDELVAEFPEIHNLHKNATALNDLLANKVSPIFWEGAFKNEIQNLFDASEKNDITCYVNEIIAKSEGIEELRYKEFYDSIIRLKEACNDNRELYVKFATYLKNDRLYFSYSYKKEDNDMHYFTLFEKCRSGIENFINEKYNTETEDKKAFLTNTFNKYLSFLYLLYYDNNLQKQWTYNTKDILSDQQAIIKLISDNRPISYIKFFTKDNTTLATFSSKKLTELIKDSVLTQIPIKILFNPNNYDKNKEIEYKIEIFNLLNSETKFRSSLVKAVALGIKESQLMFNSENKEYELAYYLIDTLIPNFLEKKKSKFESEGGRIRSIYRTTKEHMKENFFCLTYQGYEKSISNTNYQPKLIYTDNSGEQKIITSFSDLF